MMPRPIAILCSLLALTSPCLHPAGLAKHSREHVQAAEAGHGHSHPDGHVPHHEHDQDGDPVPVSEPTIAFTARLSSCGANELAQFLTFELSGLTAADGVDAVSRISIRKTEAESLRLPGPSPGNNLPLLI